MKEYILERIGQFNLEENKMKMEYLHSVEKANDFFVYKMTVEKVELFYCALS